MFRIRGTRTTRSTVTTSNASCRLLHITMRITVMSQLANGSRNWRVSRRGAEHVGCAQRGAARTQAKASTSRLKVACASSMCLSEW